MAVEPEEEEINLCLPITKNWVPMKSMIRYTLQGKLFVSTYSVYCTVMAIHILGPLAFAATKGS